MEVPFHNRKKNRAAIVSLLRSLDAKKARSPVTALAEAAIENRKQRDREQRQRDYEQRQRNHEQRQFLKWCAGKMT